MVSLGQKLKGCHSSENIGVIKDVIYKVKQVNRDELQFRVEGLTHWFDFSDVPGVWFDEVKELNNTIRIGDKVRGLKLTGHDLSNETGVVERIQEEWVTIKFSNNIVSYPLYLLIDRDKNELNIFDKCLNEWDENNKELNIPKHYNNDKGTLYKVAQERGWNAYLFDIVKRLERAKKKGVFIEDLDKSIVVIELWKKENNI